MIQGNDPLIVEKRMQIEQKLGYQFRDPLILIQALTHSSDSNRLLTMQRLLDPTDQPSVEQINSFHYERLEFLGDSILNFLLAEHFFKETANDEVRKNPKELHKLKTAMCNNIMLALVVIENGFDTYVQFNKKGNQTFST